MTKINPFKTKWGQAVDIKLFAFCPTCQAMPGSDCRYVGGGIREKSHQDRQVVYQRMVHQYKEANKAPQRGSKRAKGSDSTTLTRGAMIEHVGCSKCGAEAGSNCVNPNGQKRKKVHFERMQEAQKHFQCWQEARFKR